MGRVEVSRASSEELARVALEAAALLLRAQVEPGPCPTDAPTITSCSGMPLVRCELRAGHAGDHESGQARWWGPTDEDALRAQGAVDFAEKLADEWLADDARGRPFEPPRVYARRLQNRARELREGGPA